MALVDDLGIRIRPARPGDEVQWAELFAAYCQSGGVHPDQEHLRTVWRWMLAPERPTRCIVAEYAEPTALGTDHDGDVNALSGLIGLAHVRRFERPMDASEGMWLDDLFTVSAARGRGVARALVAEVRALAGREGCSVVRWTTGETNAGARSLYDGVAVPRDVLSYETSPIVP